MREKRKKNSQLTLRFFYSSWGRGSYPSLETSSWAV
jgi:hypothetical protein